MKLNLKWNTIKLILYFCFGTFSILYFLVCILYAGRSLSWIWIWPMFSIFCVIRFWLIWRRQKGKPELFPKWVRVCYRILFGIGLSLFIIVESMICSAMQSQPEQNLEYVIVLGAGIRGSQPTRPLILRMQTALEYMKANPDTMLIASGGQGVDEDYSEAFVIGQYLMKNGIPQERILLEDKSTSTKENIENSFRIIGETSGNVGIISNGFHIYRATLLAEMLGHENVTGISTKTLLPVGLHYVVREFFGVVQLMVLGVR